MDELAILKKIGLGINGLLYLKDATQRGLEMGKRIVSLMHGLFKTLQPGLDRCQSPARAGMRPAWEP
jgi:hypothetical protein